MNGAGGNSDWCGNGKCFHNYFLKNKTSRYGRLIDICLVIWSNSITSRGTRVPKVKVKVLTMITHYLLFYKMHTLNANMYTGKVGKGDQSYHEELAHIQYTPFNV